MAAISINEKQFHDMIREGKPLLVDFWAPWCTYCRRIASAYDMVASQNQDKLTVAKVNIDEAPNLAREETIDVIPTLVFYRDGKRLGSIVAPDSKAKIDAFLRDAMAAE